MGIESDAVALSPLSSALGLGGPFRKGLLFLLNFAWASRFRLPILIMVGFMVFDIRMQLEINIDVEMRQIHYHDGDSSSESSSDDSDDSGASSDIFSDAEEEEEEFELPS